jgi:hypothetical protein
MQTNMRFGLSICQSGSYALCHEPLPPDLRRPKSLARRSGRLSRWVSALPTLLLTIKRHLHIPRHAKHHWQIPLRR